MLALFTQHRAALLASDGSKMKELDPSLLTANAVLGLV